MSDLQQFQDAKKRFLASIDNLSQGEYWGTERQLADQFLQEFEEFWFAEEHEREKRRLRYLKLKAELEDLEKEFGR